MEEGRAQEILQFWFAKLTPSDWFGGGSALDDLFRRDYGALWEDLRHLPAENFLQSPEIARAAIILFDQFPRNMHRGSALAFASDTLALAICKGVLARGWDEVADRERQFVVMPLMHSEDLADQDACVAYMTAHLPGNLEFAQKHREMISRFGRFPHRNIVLGRESSAEEKLAIEQGFAW